MADLDRIKRNVAKMAQMNAPESDIDGYISSEGVTLEQVRSHKIGSQISQPTKQPVQQKQEEVIEQSTPMLTGGVEQKVIQNWDKKGRIYYTDEQGNKIKSKTPLTKKVANKIKATATNVGDWLTTDVGENAKQRRKAVATLTTVPIGIGAGIGGMALSGALGSGLYSGAEQAIEGEFKPKQLLTDIAIGAGLGGALGLGGKYVAKPIIDKIAKSKVVKPQPQVTKEVKAEVVEQPKLNYYDEAIQKIKENPEVVNTDEFYENFDKMTSEQQSSLFDEAFKVEQQLKQPNKQEVSKEIKPIKLPSLKGIIEKEKRESRKIARSILQQATGYKKVDKRILNSSKGIDRLDDAYANDRITVAPELVRENPDLFGHVDFDELGADEKVIDRCLQILDEGGISPTEIENRLFDNYYGNVSDDLIPDQVAQEIPEQVTSGTKERGFVKSLRKNFGEDIDKQVKDDKYIPTSHLEDKTTWESLTPEQQATMLNNTDDTSRIATYGKAQAVRQAIENGEPLNVAMLDGVAKGGTKLGQEIEAYKHFIPNTPEGIALATTEQIRKNLPKQVLKLKDETSQIVDEAAKTLPKQKTREQQLKAIEKILSKRTAKPRERKSLATQLLALADNNGLTPENFARLVDKHYGIQTIDVSDYAKIQELSNRFINATTDRERDVANGLIKKFIWNKQPKKWADKDRTFRNMNMLLSLPSRLLDVTSTAAFQGVNALDELVAKGIDKIARTGVRGGVENMSPKTWAKSVARGAKEGAEDVGLGINTARSGEVDRYELGFHPQFEGVPILGGAEKALNATIRVPDRMFYEARFDSALKDLMSTGKFTAEEAEEIARKEALQAVFQGQGLLSKGSKFVRDLLNARIDNKPMFDNETVQRIADNIQLGNRVAPFVQTPANLIAEGLERSPLGLVKGGFEMATATTPQQLRQAQQTLAKGITGTTGATLGGGYLLNQVPNTIGGFTNEDLYGDDVRNLPPQSVVIGDKAVSLASMPYLTIPAGLGKALLEPDKTMPERLLNANTYTGNILSDLPMLRGLGDLYKGGADIAKVGADYALGRTDLADVGQSVGRVAGQQGANILSQYIPFSGTLGTIRNAVDPYNREMMTYNENPLLGTAEYIGNRLQNRIPFASSLLPTKYNVLGEPSMRTNIENPVARIAEATLSPVRIRNYTERPAEMEEMQRIQDYAMENDITGKTTLKFAKPKRYIGRGKDKTRLTNEQYSELTRLYSGKVYDELQFLMNTPEYQSADEKTKIKWIKEVMKEKKQEAEQEISDIIK